MFLSLLQKWLFSEAWRFSLRPCSSACSHSHPWSWINAGINKINSISPHMQEDKIKTTSCWTTNASGSSGWMWKVLCNANKCLSFCFLECNQMYRESTWIVELLIAGSKALLLIAHESDVVGPLRCQLTSLFASFVSRPSFERGAVPEEPFGELFPVALQMPGAPEYGISLNLVSTPPQIPAEGGMVVTVMDLLPAGIHSPQQTAADRSYILINKQQKLPETWPAINKQSKQLVLIWEKMWHQFQNESADLLNANIFWENKKQLFILLYTY